VSDDLETVVPSAGPGFVLRRLFHAHLRTPDLGHVERWFTRVFGRSSTRLDVALGLSDDLLNPTDHSTYTQIADLLVASIDPGSYRRDGVPFYPPTDRPRLNGFGWYVDGLEELLGWVRDLGYPVVDEWNTPVPGDVVPTAGRTEVPMFWLEPEISGLRYQFLPTGSFPESRLTPYAEAAATVRDDPLGIVRCAYHTVLTTEPKRAVRLFADVLGGTVVHEGRDEQRGLDSVYLRLADAVFEFAVPDRGSPAYTELPPGIPSDTYHAVTFQVEDLDRVARYLADGGVPLRSRTEHGIVTEPRTSLGVPWGFVPHAVPGDAR
jgi:catechol 2,3-dioxygenase-like lactoylglutathione lyase family enzyme